MARNTPSTPPDDGTEAAKAPAEETAAPKPTAVKTTAAEPLPTQARVPYPHTSLTIPGGSTTTDETGKRGDLVITREWTDLPADQVDRVKQTAYRARIKLEMRVPVSGESGE